MLKRLILAGLVILSLTGVVMGQQHRVPNDLRTAYFADDFSIINIPTLGGRLISWGATVPSAVSGYAPNALFFKTDGATPTTRIYYNSGTSTSCVFLPLVLSETTGIEFDDISVDSITGMDAQMLLLGLSSTDGGEVQMAGGNASAGTGGSARVYGGTGTGANAGGLVSIRGGSSVTGTGGSVSVTSGAGGSTSGASGTTTIATGTTTAGSGSPSGALTVQSGAGAASAAAVAGGASGAVTVRSQDGGANTGGATGQAGGAAGTVAITGGAGGATNSAGAHAGGAGGAITITGGAGGAASAGTGNGGAGGGLTLTAGAGGATTGGSPGAAGAVTITAGASAGASGTAGSVTIDTGAPTGGTPGVIQIGKTNAAAATGLTGNAAGTIVAGKCTVVSETVYGPFHQTTLSLTLTGDNDLDLADDDHGAGVKIYDFPQGAVTILGAVGNFSVADNGQPDGNYYLAVGSAVAADDNDLTSTEADIIPKITQAGGGASPVVGKGQMATQVLLDGTTSPASLNVNVAVAAGNISGAATLEVTGTLTVTWVNNGDY